MIKLNEVHKVYTQGKSGFHALKNISLYFEKGEIISIFGPSGCGKTTLLNIIGGLDSPTSGDMVIDDRLTTNFIEKEWDYFRNHRIGFVFQQYNLIEHLPIVENVALSVKLAGASNKKAKIQAIELLKKVGLEDHLHKLPGALSGGERQRVAIARALINEPDIILADEPTGALDNKTGMEIMDLIKSICADKLVIIVTHDKLVAKRYSTRLIELKDGRVISDTRPIDKMVNISNVKTKRRSKLKFKEALRFSLYNIKGKIWRTLLVSLGLSIGIVGLILIDAFFNSVRTGLEQQNAVLKNNPDLYIHEQYVEDYDLDAIRNHIDNYDYFKEILYAPRNNYTILENASDSSPLLYPVVNTGVEAPDNSSILETFTGLIGDSRFPINDNEIMLNIEAATLLVSSNLNLTDEEIWEELKNNQYIIYDEYNYVPDQYSLFRELNDEVCAITDIWGGDPNILPDGYDELVMGPIDDNILALSFYRNTPLQISETEEIYCTDYDTLDWNLNRNEPIGDGITVTLVGIHDNGLFPEFILSDNIIFSATYQVDNYLNSEELEILYYSSIRFRAFLNNDDLDAKASIILNIESDNYLVEENFNNGFDMFAGLTNLFMYILQFIFSSIVFIAIVTGGLMLLLILFISIIERKREIGLIRAMGGTRNDVRIIYTGETTIIGLIAGVFSVILSIILIAILNVVIYNRYLDLIIEYLPFVDPTKVLAINYTKLLFAILGSIGIAIISGLAPAIRASRKKPIEALRNE
jgi:putative ABC transport system permease protein